MSRLSRSVYAVLALAILGTAAVGAASAAEVELKDGRVLKGKVGRVASLADQPQAMPGGVGPLQLIVFLDDDVRRIFVSKYQVVRVGADDAGLVEEKFNIRQIVRASRAVKSVGPVIRIDPFDEFGRRIFTFNTVKGPVDVIQGITRLTPRWAKVEGLSYIWDMRIATSSIPADILHKILWKQIDPQDIEHRKKIARFYLQSERYEEAQETLEGILESFPDAPNLEEQLAPSIRSLRQLGARRLLNELQLRSRAGQHRLVLGKLKAFPSEGVAGEILQAVREMVEQYATTKARGEEVMKLIDDLLARVEDVSLKQRITPIRDEIAAELNVNTLQRLTAFRLAVEDVDRLPQEKLALAISGWLIGSDASVENPAIALSLYRTRDLVRRYVAESIKVNRQQILGYLRSEEGAQPKLVAALLAHMKPPVDTPEPEDSAKPGFYTLKVQGSGQEGPVRYLVQLPPEYDPYRRYPTIVTLNGAGTTPRQQVDWWAGAWTGADDGRWRSGQATRHGYIVIAPQWTTEHQKRYGYSAREHAAVLSSLRDACRRFSVDVDRVFLSGHSMGGDAAWDMGLAHPDLWAGVIPIVARSDRYCALYWENAKNLPFYVVCGELDGTKMADNTRDLDRYLKRGYNCTVVEYQGRGHEHFYDEIQRLFDWMNHCKRDFFPREFSTSTMRPWDNFFWWVELEGLPERSMVDPAEWTSRRGRPPVEVTAKLTQTNGVNVRTGTARVRVWVSPEMLDFENRVTIVVNGRRMNSRDPFVKPNLETLLEDVRTRSDRQHPFWAKFEMPTGR